MKRECLQADRRHQPALGGWMGNFDLGRKNVSSVDLKPPVGSGDCVSAFPCKPFLARSQNSPRNPALPRDPLAQPEIARRLSTALIRPDPGPGGTRRVWIIRH